MKKSRFTPLLMLGLGVLALRTSCDKRECYDSTVFPATISKMSIVHLANRGQAPVPISPGQTGSASAYGFRLNLATELKNADDTLGAKCPEFMLEPFIQKMEIRALTGLGPDFPPGAEVSDLFRQSLGSFQAATLHYEALSFSPQFLNDLTQTLAPVEADFLQVGTTMPPAWYQFDIQLFMSDSTILSVKTDSVFLQ